MFSTTGTRAAIAAALSTVSGVRGSAYQPKTVRTGQAWPEFVGATRGPGDAWEATWRVMVVLSADPTKASQQIDTLSPLLVDALDPLIFTDAIDVGTLTTSGGETTVIQITGRGE
jgi:hypothetical protein